MVPEIDVIILSWNRIDDTIMAIESALAQTAVHTRVQVVDQGSSSENLDRLRQFVDTRRSQVELRELGRNVGVAAGRNIATRMGRAPCVVALDNDAVFARSDTLARASRLLSADPRLGAIAFRIRNYFTGRDDEMCWDYPEALRAHADRDFFVTRFVGAGHAMRRDAFEAAGGYDDSLFFGGEERDISYRMLNRGYHIRYVPSLAVRHKVDPEARVRWDSGRYYYAVRNSLYIEYKFGAPWRRLARIAAGAVAKGAYNGLLGQSLRAVANAAPMAARFSRQAAARPLHDLGDEARAYIRRHERVGAGTEPFWDRLRRPFQKLPGSA